MVHPFPTSVPTMMVVWRLLFAMAALAAAQSWEPVTSGTTANLRGVSAIDDRIVWASGSKGTVIRSVDGGKTWRMVAPPGAADLDFRDIQALDERTAFVMSSGEGSKSRLYKTTDGGANWTLLATNLEPRGFWDCMSFWDPTHGILIGDPVDGRFTVMITNDGLTWQQQKGPSANKNEGAFAASGSCVFTLGNRDVWFGTGGIDGGRVFHSEDGGKSWSAAKTPIRHDSANAGIFSLAFLDAMHGVAVGGDYTKPDESAGTGAITEDGGRTWKSVAVGGPSGYRSAVLYRAGHWIATGPSGSDWSAAGDRWTKFGAEGYSAIGGGWAVGNGGRVARIVVGGR